MTRNRNRIGIGIRIRNRNRIKHRNRIRIRIGNQIRNIEQGCMREAMHVEDRNLLSAAMTARSGGGGPSVGAHVKTQRGSVTGTSSSSVLAVSSSPWRTR